MNRLRVTTYISGAVTLALVGLCISLLWNGVPAQVSLDAGKKKAELLTIAAQFPKISNDYTAIRLRSLFYSSREYYVAPPPPEMEPPLPKPNFRLSGILLIPNKPVLALLVNGDTQQTRKVVQGETIDMWTVVTIENNRVVLQHGSQTEELLKDARTSRSGLTVQRLIRNTITTQNGVVKLAGNGNNNSVGNTIVPSTVAPLQPRVYRQPVY